MSVTRTCKISPIEPKNAAALFVLLGSLPEPTPKVEFFCDECGWQMSVLGDREKAVFRHFPGGPPCSTKAAEQVAA